MKIILAALIAAFSLSPLYGESLDLTRFEVIDERVDLMEVNHFYDEHGELVLDQVIFWVWSPHNSRFNVQAWQLIKKPTQVPIRNWSNRDYVAVWQDGEQLRKVRAATMLESWTQYDPEVYNRQVFPKKNRKGLINPPEKKVKVALLSMVQQVFKLLKIGDDK